MSEALVANLSSVLGRILMNPTPEDVWLLQKDPLTRNVAPNRTGAVPEDLTKQDWAVLEDGRVPKMMGAHQERGTHLPTPISWIFIETLRVT